MLIRFSFVNTQSGKTGIPAYVEANEIASWSPWIVPDPIPPGLDRSLRGKTFVVLNLKPGHMHWCDESFDAVSARILEAACMDPLKTVKAYQDAAELHRELAAAEAVKKSPLSVS